MDWNDFCVNKLKRPRLITSNIFKAETPRVLDSNLAAPLTLSKQGKSVCSVLEAFLSDSKTFYR